ncbi:LysR family transcriptional regulator [Micromonospora peucetia]|nr:LysR family transcriptional regulator [Micromonospora peucetia]MCX4389010.1 LysR family transcriptional regulator [Micromonospora peucetia]WSA35217.1 LysR family transcriptional regulator [Micromonospora peucetia]
MTRLRSFVRLAEELHFGRAAKLLHITQPALSQQIARLEKDVDTVLLLRGNRGVSLTPAGRVFLRGARAALQLMDETTLAARQRASRAESRRLCTTCGPRPDEPYDLLLPLTSRP